MIPEEGLPSEPPLHDPAGDAGQSPGRGQWLLANSRFNKGSAFTHEERQAFHLEGLLPPQVNTMEQQLRRSYANITRKSDALERYIGLLSLQDRNETLFYRLLLEHVEEFLPIVYTPTVGLACQQYSQIYRRQHGLWITPEQGGRIHQILGNAPCQDVRLIVVTDNERILGLGDQGAGGMAIAMGKTVLYTVAAGIHPNYTLPISLDVGTDNAALLDDELYLGWRHRRLRGEEYDAFVEQFVRAVKHCFPRALLQWEDFKQYNAFHLLDRYRHRLLSFNDDIQGTAAIGVSAILAGVRATDIPLTEQRVVIVGAGAAGVGIARLLHHTLRQAGVQGPALQRAIVMLDSTGFLHDGRELNDPTKREFAWPAELARADGLPMDRPDDLEAVVRAARPTVLIGTTGQPGIFTQGVVTAMAEHVRRPVILPFSNPTSLSEGVPADIIAWTQGRALVATGSPFEPVKWGDRTIRIGQGNNVFVFPGVGLGVLVAEASEVTDSMFSVAARTLAAYVSQQDLASGSLFPPLRDLRQISARIAEAVVRQAREEGVGRPIRDEQIPASVAAAMWDADYPDLSRISWTSAR